MAEWTKTFVQLAQSPPRLSQTDDGYANEFWEKLYEAFRDRMLYEIAEGDLLQTRLNDE